ncbi:hypothetical protein D3C84_1149670 [compost metagenome]
MLHDVYCMVTIQGIGVIQNLLGRRRVKRVEHKQRLLPRGISCPETPQLRDAQFGKNDGSVLLQISQLLKH